MSCAPLDIQRSKLAIVVLQSCNKGKTYFHFVFSTKLYKTSFEKTLCYGSYNWGHRCIHSLFKQTFSRNYIGKLFLTTNRSSTNCCCSTSPSSRGLLATKKLEIEELEILGHFLACWTFPQSLSKNCSPFPQIFCSKQHDMHQHCQRCYSICLVIIH